MRETNVPTSTIAFVINYPNINHCVRDKPPNINHCVRDKPPNINVFVINYPIPTIAFNHPQKSTIAFVINQPISTTVFGINYSIPTIVFVINYPRSTIALVIIYPKVNHCIGDKQPKVNHCIGDKLFNINHCITHFFTIKSQLLGEVAELVNRCTPTDHCREKVYVKTEKQKVCL